MNKIHQRKITKSLKQISLENLAKETKFYLRKPKKIDVFNFILSFYLVLLKKNYSLRLWAAELTQLLGQEVSFQMIAKKLQIRQLPFIKMVFAKALNIYFEQNKYFSSKPLLSPFNRVLIEDSTCIKLVDALKGSFAGAKNQYKKSATCRIQFCLDIKSNGIENVELTSLVKNDLTYADNILERIQAHDLIIRDLGYIIIEVLGKINQLGAFFISRLKIDTCVFDEHSEQRIDLVKVLKKSDRNQIRRIDRKIKIGTKNKLTVRLVAIKLNEKQAQKRRNHAKKSRGKKKESTISKAAMYLMSWNIFITNIEEEILTVEQVYELYSIRWHIEIIFKNWKSNFKLDSLINSCRSPNPVKPEILLYLFLSFIVLIYIPKLNHFQQVIFEKHQRHLSPYKFATFLMNNIEFIFEDDQEQILSLLLRFCCYDKRSDRLNLYEKIYGLAA